MIREKDAGIVVSHQVKISACPLCVLTLYCSYHVMRSNTFVTAVIVSYGLNGS